MQRRTTPEPTRRTVVTAGLTAALTAAAGAAAGGAEAAVPRSGGQGGRARAAGAAPRPGRPTRAPSGRWDTFNLSPRTRTLRPVAVFRTAGTVDRPEALATGGRAPARTTRLRGAGSAVTYDFGQEVGGYVTLAVAPGSETNQTVGLTYSELSTYVSSDSSDGSNGGSNDEPAVQYTAPPGGTVATATDVPVAGAGPAAAADPRSQLRGGFRYLTIVNTGGGTVELAEATVALTFAPNAADLSAYPNYFWCDDDLLTRIWYAGAYTVQTNILATDQGRVWGPPDLGWDNSATVGDTGTTVLVDGAKRDRTVWPGDLGISVLTDYVSLGDLPTVRNSLQTLFDHQDQATGALPYAGPAVDFIGNSDAYHLWTLIGAASYVQLSGDTGWARGLWPALTKAMAFSTAKLDTDGLFAVTASADWARGDADGKNLEANAIMYRALTVCAALAEALGDTASAADWQAKAAALRAAVEAGGYWDAAAGLYRDKPSGAGAALYPQDGNALAVWFGLVPDQDRAAAVSRALAARWTAVGALTPEKSADSVHPFPGGMEVHAHFTAGRAGTALDLIRREWGYMLNAPQGTASTFWEGYRTDGTSDYSGSYMSAAHGWSTGPTSALTYHLLGIAPAADSGAGHRIQPRPGGQRRAEGRLTTAAGPVTASWHRGPGASFDLSYDAPAGAVTEVAVPVPADGRCTVRLDGRTVWDGAPRAAGTTGSDGYVRLTRVPAGTHRVTVRAR